MLILNVYVSQFQRRFASFDALQALAVLSKQFLSAPNLFLFCKLLWRQHIWDLAVDLTDHKNMHKALRLHLLFSRFIRSPGLRN